MNQETLKQQLILSLAKDGIFTKKHLLKLQREKCRIYGGDFFRNIDLLKTYHKLVKSKKLKAEIQLEDLLTIKHVRSLSGIVVVSVLTKPYPCPGKCLYCPTEKDVPKSYLSSEPAVMRAIALNYDPYVQTTKRLEALEMEGHPTDKINIRIIGGTWSAYPEKYRNWFASELYRACNEYENSKHEAPVSRQGGRNPKQYQMLKIQNSKQKLFGKFKNSNLEFVSNFGFRISDLNNLQHENETAKHRIVEISIETRQDFINEKEIKHLRKLGVTKVELGVQSIYDDILRLNNRGHLVNETIKATKLLKDAGFKVSYQMMLNLYDSNMKRDKEMFKQLFNNPRFKPDHLKIYPLALVKNSDLYQLYIKKKFRPYTKNQLVKILKEIKEEIPYYCRIERIIRDIPAENIVEGGTKFSNMRQVVAKEMIEEGNPCKCIRCREVKDQLNNITIKQYNNLSKAQLASSETKSGSQAHWKVASATAPIERTSFCDERETDIYLFKEIYNASNGKEIFLSIENKERTKLYSMLRLRIPSQFFENKKHFLRVLQDSAIIREIHTYGQQIEISKSGNASQHKGFGKFLIEEAENISHQHKVKKIAVIAGIGARGYFNKYSYKLKDSYMIKNL